MNNNDILFQALGSIGAMPYYYTHTDTCSSFVQLVWTDNTIKQQPSETAKKLISHLSESISISSSCVYGIPKDAQYPKYICPAASSAAAYNFFVSSIIFNLSALPSFLNTVRSNIEGIINGTTTTAEFYDTCFSLLKINNFTHFLVEAADPLTKNFSDTISIQPLLPQIDQISAAVKEIVSKSDQLQTLITNQMVTPQNVLSYNDTINSFINIIPQYTQAYSTLLIQLHNEFIGIYSNDNHVRKNVNKESDEKDIDAEFNLFVQKMYNYISPIQKVIFLATELLTQKPLPGVCDNLLMKLKNLVDNINEMVYNYSKLMHFRGDQFELYKKIFLEKLANNSALLDEIKTQFTQILSVDIPPAFQNYMNEELKTSLDVLVNSNSTQLRNDFYQILRLIQSDPRSIVFSPILGSSVPSNQLNSLSLKAIKILHSIAAQLRSDQLKFQEINNKLSELHPTIKYLLTVIYNEMHKNMMNHSKRKSSKKKKSKLSDFSFPPEIIVLNQKKSYIQNLFVSFDESLHKLSPGSPTLRIAQDNCALKAILLALAIATLETSPEIQQQIIEIHSILIDFADNYCKDNESTIREIIKFFNDGKNVPEEPKPQYMIVIKNLTETTNYALKVFQEELSIKDITELRKRINLIKKKVTEYEKLSLIFSSLQYLDESYLPDNRYHETILYLQQNMINIVKTYQNISQLYVYQNFMCLSKIFALNLNLIRHTLPHSSKESNYLNLISDDLNRNRSNMISLNTCGIGFDPESYKLLKSEIELNINYLKERKDFYKSKIETNYFKDTLEKSLETLDEFYQTSSRSVDYLEISEVDYNVPQRDCIGPILKHFTLLINYTFDKYALALINNLPTVVQFAMNLNDLLRELDKALRYIPQSTDKELNSLLSVSELEKIQSKFESPGRILFQRTSEIPLVSDFFKDDKNLLNLALQSKKEIIKEAIANVMNYLQKIVKFTQNEVFKFEDVELNKQKTKYESVLEQSKREYEIYRKEQLEEEKKKLDEQREEVREKDRIEKEKKEKEERLEREKKEEEEKERKVKDQLEFEEKIRLEKQEIERKQLIEKAEIEQKKREEEERREKERLEREENERLEEKKRLLFKEPNTAEINPIFGMGLYIKCAFNPDDFQFDPNSDIDKLIDIEKLSDFSSSESITKSVFENAVFSEPKQNNEEKNNETKVSDLISDLKRQLMPPDYLLTAIECGLLKESQDNNNNDQQNEDDEDDAMNLFAKNENDDDDEEDNEDGENSGGDFDFDNDPILGNRNMVEDDDEFFESCSDDDDEEEEEHKNFFPWS